MMFTDPKIYFLHQCCNKPIQVKIHNAAQGMFHFGECGCDPMKIDTNNMIMDGQDVSCKVHDTFTERKQDG